MNQRSLNHLFGVTASALVLSIGPLAAQSAKDAVGTWSLVSAEAFGSNPRGTMMLDASGHFSTILMRTTLPKYASNNRTQGTPDDNKNTVTGSLAYFGTYTINGTELTLHIVGSTFPNWDGLDQKRTNLSITADELKYVQPTPSGGGAPAPVVWKRVK